MDLFQKLALLGSNIFTGSNPGGISPEQNRAAVGQGLTAAGLRTILASQPGAGPGGAAPTALGAIAQGALAGQEAGGRSRATAARQNTLSGADLTSAEGIAQILPAFLNDPDMFGELVKLQGQLATEPTQPDRVDLGDRIVFYDPNDPSRIVETMLKTPEAGEAENKLATEYSRAIAPDIEVARALGRVLASAEAPSAAGDMSLVFAYMKLLDPGSSVREGEQATARNAGSVPQRIIALYNQALNGQTFDESVRRDFVDRTRRLVEGQRPLLNQQIDRFRRRAERQDADPSLIIFDPYAPFEGFLSGETQGLPGSGPAPAPVVPPGTINPITGQPVGRGN